MKKVTLKSVFDDIIRETDNALLESLLQILQREKGGEPK